MPSQFEMVILRLKDLGAFEFLFPFMLTAAVFYGLLRRSKLFGDPEANVAVNAVVAIVAAFMVWAYPVLSGVSIQQQFSTFMFLSTVALLVIVVGLLISSMFLPEDLPARIGEKIGGKGVGIVLIAAILIGGAVLVGSGLVNVFLPQTSTQTPGLSQDTILTLAVILILVGSVAAIVIVPAK